MTRFHRIQRFFLFTVPGRVIGKLIIFAILFGIGKLISYYLI